jgi:hypothetical protein
MFTGLTPQGLKFVPYGTTLSTTDGVENLKLLTGCHWRSRQMNNLTDLEICKRIAEIEGIKVTVAHKRTSYASLYLSNDIGDRKGYSPLTDDALCFQLMNKYCVDLQCYENDSGKLMYWIANEYFLGDYENPNKAICLAIIEIYK